MMSLDELAKSPKKSEVGKYVVNWRYSMDTAITLLLDLGYYGFQEAV